MGQFRLVSLQLPILRNLGKRVPPPPSTRHPFSLSPPGFIMELLAGGIALIAVTRFIRALECRLSNCVSKNYTEAFLLIESRNERLMRPSYGRIHVSPFRRGCSRERALIVRLPSIAKTTPERERKPSTMIRRKEERVRGGAGRDAG